MKDESVRFHDIINNLKKAEARIKELEAKIPAIVVTAVITALRDPAALQQLIHAISEFQVTMD